ncbi:MAG: transposase [Clostridiales bacterium]|nr:transposase [Clostridiales bacterium]
MSGRQKDSLTPDIVVKNYWSNNEVFSDLFNAVLFDGEQVIHPEALMVRDTDNSVVKERNDGVLDSVKGLRDSIKIHKRSTAQGVELVLLGLENQERVHYAMPLRVMGYDHGVYQKQYNDNAKKFRASLDRNSVSDDEFLSGMRRTDRFVPVVTVVVYYGEKPWDGAKTLHEMLDIPESMKRYVNDYRMILVEARENRLKFRNKNNQDFFNLLEIILDTGISKKVAKEKAIQYCRENQTDRDVIIAAAGVTDTKLDYNALVKKEGDTMCTLFEEIAKEGEARGETKVNILITKLSELGRIDDIIRSAADSVYQQELFREFGL